MHGPLTRPVDTGSVYGAFNIAFNTNVTIFQKSSASQDTPRFETVRHILTDMRESEVVLLLSRVDPRVGSSRKLNFSLFCLCIQYVDK